jgi:RNA polymerase sigma-70 factor (sigma-E family)
VSSGRVSTFGCCHALLLGMGSGESVSVASAPDFPEFVKAQSRGLLQAAWLLTGDWALAEDLVQTALTRTWPKWDGIAVEARLAYVQRVLTTSYMASRRRRWIGEVPVGEHRDDAATNDPFSQLDTRQVLLNAIRRLPARQRAAIVLRYFLDLTETDTALAMGCSLGSVKTHTARALGTLRTVPGLVVAVQEGTTS